jgi:hypothetical protein
MEMFEGEQTIETGDERGGLISRRSFSKYVLAAGAAAAGVAVLVPRAADAAAVAPDVFLFKYYSATVCSVLPGEKYCSTASGGTPFTALRINGGGFTKGGYVRVRVRNYATDEIYFTKYVYADQYGTFSINTTIEVGSSSTPGAVYAYARAYDYGKNYATTKKKFYIAK